MMALPRSISQTLALVFFLFIALFFLVPATHADIQADVCERTQGSVGVESGTIHYQEAGNGFPVLLLHGVYANNEQWNTVLCLLAAAGYRGIAPDLPGYGNSTSFPTADYSLWRQAEHLREFIAQLDLAEVMLAGNSMGGTIAAIYTKRYPETVASLAFIGGPFAAVDWSPRFRAALYEGINPLIPVTSAEFELELELLLVEPPELTEEVKQLAIADYVERNRHYQQIWSILGLYNRWFADHEITTEVPVLILWGEQDHIFPASGAKKLQIHYPHSHVIILEQAGHLPHLEHPAETMAIFLDFLHQVQ